MSQRYILDAKTKEVLVSVFYYSNMKVVVRVQCGHSAGGMLHSPPTGVRLTFILKMQQIMQMMHHNVQSSLKIIKKINCNQELILQIYLLFYSTAYL